ncbi:hypothetical protein R1sor_016616 [Riccia sorocarpa]|uniref:MLO-like protein n=1 Tax=Riccia sorocarpa TaxID=122646 RepID=A0ABD3HIB0_9MARC
MAEVEGGGRSLEYSATWTFVVVCGTFVVVSFIIVKIIEKVEERLRLGKKKSLVHAVDKMKEELMLLGFISLLLTVFGNLASTKICVKTSALERMTPCDFSQDSKAVESDASAPAPLDKDGNSTRRLLEEIASSLMERAAREFPVRRELTAGAGTPSSCPAGKEPFISATGLHQLHIFIFLMAVVHVVYSLAAMYLATTKVRSWKKWEDEVQAKNQREMEEMIKSINSENLSNFVAYHSSQSGNRVSVWAVCFLRQFGITVRKADYLSLRMGFIKTHNTGNDFNFHSYMIRCMEDEFHRVVGISAWLWLFVLGYLLFNVHGVNLYFWISFLPVTKAVILGAKLQHIIATLALESAKTGGPQTSIRLRDDLFWFSKPKLVLLLMHFILFQNAFELATFFWYLWQFHPYSCLLKNKGFLATRVTLSVLTQILCSYSTLPLYALVTQMGSQYKRAIFQDDVKQKLKRWRQDVNIRAKAGGLSGESPRSPCPEDIDEDSHDRSADGSNAAHHVYAHGLSFRMQSIDLFDLSLA